MIAKVNRMIMDPQSHALLMGYGGSGRKSVTKLAAFMQGYKVYQLKLNSEFNYEDWYDFLRDLLREIGVGE